MRRKRHSRQPSNHGRGVCPEVVLPRSREIFTTLGTNNPVIALAAISRIERQLELEAKLLGQLDESTKIAVGVNVAPQEAADYSKVPLEQLTQAT